MKSIIKTVSYSAVLAISILFIYSCGKDEAPKVEEDLSSKIYAIIPDSLVKSLEAKGMTINKGNTPPNVEGIFFTSPHKLISNYGPDDSYSNGRIVTDYWYKIFDQVNDEAKLSYTNKLNDKADGLGTFISGSGNKFTLFSQSTGVNKQIPYKTVSVISGEKTEKGIKNFQYGFVMTYKEGDKNNTILMPVGKSRLYIDDDLMSEWTPNTNFSKLASELKNTSNNFSIVGN